MNTLVRLIQLKLRQAILSGELGRVVGWMLLITIGLALTLGSLSESGAQNASGLIGVLPISLGVFMVVFVPTLTEDHTDQSWLNVEPFSPFSRLWLNIVYPLKLWGLIQLLAFMVSMPFIISHNIDMGIVAAGYLAGISLACIGLGLYRSVFSWHQQASPAMLISIGVLWALLHIDAPVWIKSLQFLVGTGLAQVLCGASLARHYTSLASGFITTQDLSIIFIYVVGLTSLCLLRSNQMYWRELSHLKKFLRQLIAVFIVILMAIGFWLIERLPAHGLDITQNHRYTLSTSELAAVLTKEQWVVNCRPLPPETPPSNIFVATPRWAIVVNDAEALFTATSVNCSAEARAFNHLSLTFTRDSQSHSLNTAINSSADSLFFGDVIGTLSSLAPLPPITLGVLAPGDTTAHPEYVESRLSSIKLVNVSDDVVKGDEHLQAVWENDEVTPDMDARIDRHVKRIIGKSPPWNDSDPASIDPMIETLLMPKAQREFITRHAEGPAPAHLGDLATWRTVLFLLATSLLGLFIARKLTRYLSYRQRDLL